ncbi:MAG: hypothetical protein ACI9J3_001603 [Parvicellaceae bacterium]|jgi:hypothetical protein
MNNNFNVLEIQFSQLTIYDGNELLWRTDYI